jgi:hypothetical protein
MPERPAGSVALAQAPLRDPYRHETQAALVTDLDRTRGTDPAGAGDLAG